MYSNENMVQLTLYNQTLVFLYEVMCNLLGSHLGFSKHVLMAVPCRFIYSLEEVTDKKTCPCNIFQISQKKNLQWCLYFKITRLYLFTGTLKTCSKKVSNLQK